MQHRLTQFPWLSMTCISLAYGLLGWELSFLEMHWVLEFWLISVAAMFVLIWKRHWVSRWVQFGPSALISIFVISLVFTLAITFAERFGLALVLILSLFWGELDLYAQGVKQRFAMIILALVSAGGLTAGWYLSRNFLMLIDLLRYWLPGI